MKQSCQMNEVCVGDMFFKRLCSGVCVGFVCTLLTGEECNCRCACALVSSGAAYALSPPQNTYFGCSANEEYVLEVPM